MHVLFLLWLHQSKPVPPLDQSHFHLRRVVKYTSLLRAYRLTAGEPVDENGPRYVFSLSQGVDRHDGTLGVHFTMTDHGTGKEWGFTADSVSERDGVVFAQGWSRMDGNDAPPVWASVGMHRGAQGWFVKVAARMAGKWRSVIETMCDSFHP